MSSYSYYCPFPIWQPQQQHHSLSSSFPYYQRQQQQQQQLLSCCSQSPLFRQRLPCSRLQEISVAEEEEHHENTNKSSSKNNDNNKKKKDKDDDGEVGISKIQVPRQKHIPVSKSQLLDAILSIMFDQDAAHHFRLLTS
ncbi:hypothetical protein TSUD_259310 [Trifolium subterraneum]|uniref:Uncharacterized protein n=1 Tax=Trifolium subterraneum TaxID=3900 RepID=A0A2Z6MU00_TRISU|nr:hypothetical protein TSUD_259310 [Trifolium subterraneum]